MEIDEESIPKHVQDKDGIEGPQIRNTLGHGQPLRKLDKFCFTDNAGEFKSLEDKRVRPIGVGFVSAFGGGADQVKARIGPIIRWDIVYAHETALWVQTAFAWYQLKEVHDHYEYVFSKLFNKFLLCTSVVHTLRSDPACSVKHLVSRLRTLHKSLGLRIEREYAHASLVKNSRFLRSQVCRELGLGFTAAPDCVQELIDLAKSNSKPNSDQPTAKDTNNNTTTATTTSTPTAKPQAEKPKKQAAKPPPKAKPKYPIEDSELQGEWTGPEAVGVDVQFGVDEAVFNQLITPFIMLNSIGLLHPSVGIITLEEILECFPREVDHDVHFVSLQCARLHMAVLTILLDAVTALSTDEPDQPGQPQKPGKRKREASDRVELVGPRREVPLLNLPHQTNLCDRDTWPEGLRVYLNQVHPEMSAYTNTLSSLPYCELALSSRILIFETLLNDMLLLSNTREQISSNLVEAQTLLKEHARKQRNKETEAEDALSQINERMFVVRLSPLGYDRYHRSYWWCGGKLPGGFLYQEDGEGNWRCFNSLETLVSLAAALNRNGIRERQLHAKLAVLLEQQAKAEDPDFEGEVNGSRAKLPKRSTSVVSINNLPPAHERVKAVLLSVLQHHVSDSTLAPGATRAQLTVLQQKVMNTDDITSLASFTHELLFKLEPRRFSSRWARLRACWNSDDSAAEQGATNFDETSCPVHLLVARVLELKHFFDQSIDEAVCERCHSGDFKRTNQLLLCDGCDVGFHMNCLSPPLTRVPTGDWFCPTCAAMRRSAIIRHSPEVSSGDEESDGHTKAKRRRKAPGSAKPADSSGDSDADNLSSASSGDEVEAFAVSTDAITRADDDDDEVVVEDDHDVDDDSSSQSSSSATNPRRTTRSQNKGKASSSNNNTSRTRTPRACTIKTQPTNTKTTQRLRTSDSPPQYHC